MKQMRIRPLFITGLLFICGLLVAGSADAAKKKDLTPAPDWHAMTRGEHIAWLTLTPETKALVREAMQKRIASLLKIFPAQMDMSGAGFDRDGITHKRCSFPVPLIRGRFKDYFSRVKRRFQ